LHESDLSLLGAGTLTKNEMTVTKAWVAGRSIGGIAEMVAGGSDGKGGMDSLLDPRVVSTLNQAIALNCTASLRRQASGAKQQLLYRPSAFPQGEMFSKNI
jgi:magnesium-transporting ATPase (P-type)